VARPDDLPPAAAPLLAVPPARFVPERDALARRLADAGDAADAAAVRKVRRPVGLAWVLNRLALDRAAPISALLDAGARLRAGHAAALAGEGAEALRAAGDALHAATRALRAPAEAALREAGRAAAPGSLARVELLLRAAALADDGTQEVLRRGALRREPDVAAPGGGAFGAAFTGAPAEGPGPGARRAHRAGAGGRARPGARARGAEGGRADRARRAADERAERARARELERASRAVRAAERAARDARREADRAERGLEAARRAADAEATRAERARARAADAEAEVARRRERMEGIRAHRGAPAGS
jgi:hypothetical protein